MTRLQRCLGMIGLATVIVIPFTVVPALLGYRIPDLPRNMILGALFILGMLRIFWPTSWPFAVMGALAMVGLTYLESFPAMKTTAVNVVSWAAILLGALAVGLFQRRRAHGGS